LNSDSLSRIFSMARNRGSRPHFDANSLNVNLTETLTLNLKDDGHVFHSQN